MKSILVFLLVFCLISCIIVTNCVGEHVKKSVDDNRDDNGDPNDEPMDASMDVPVENEPNNVTCTRRQNSQLHEIRSAQHKQFPFMVAVMSHNNEFLCSGTVVSNGMILTTASCLKQSISYILLNATKAKKDETTIDIHITRSEKFPTSDADKDVGLIYVMKHNNSIASKIRLSNYTSTRSVLDVEVLGFGLNSDVGQTKEMQYIGLENRGYPIPLVDSRDLIRGYFDCIDTKVLTCFKDTGGPAIFDNELVGIVVKGQPECIKEMTSTYAVNKQMVEVLPTYTFKAWLEEKINKNEEQEVEDALPIFPMKPARRVFKETPIKRSAGNTLANSSLGIVGLLFVFVINI